VKLENSVKRSLWIGLMDILVIFFIAALVTAMILLPFIFNKYTGFAGSQTFNSLWIKVFLYFTAAPFMALLIMTKKIINNIKRKDPFCHSSITALNIISICAFTDFVLYAIGTAIIFKNLLSLTLAIAAFMVGLTSLVLSQLVKEAMKIKQENDLTI